MDTDDFVVKTFHFIVLMKSKGKTFTVSCVCLLNFSYAVFLYRLTARAVNAIAISVNE